MIKKIFIIFVMFLTSLPGFTGGIGFVNYEEIINNYKFANITKQELDMKGKELNAFLKQKEEEYKLLESPVQKSKFEGEMEQEILKREEAFNNFVQKREEVVKKKINDAIEQVRTQKGLDAVLDSESVYSGGTDITKDVLQILNL